MKAEIRKIKPEQTFFTEERCYINELSNFKDDPEVSIALAKVKPSVTTRKHRLLGITERYIILEGNGLVEIGDLPPEQVSFGDVVLIPPGTPQSIKNTGQIDLTFLAICSPRFVQDAYEDIDNAC